MAHRKNVHTAQREFVPTEHPLRLSLQNGKGGFNW